MQILKGKLLQVDTIIPKPNKNTGEVKSPYASLSIQSKFVKFGRIVPEVVTVNIPLEDASKYQNQIEKDVSLEVYFPLPQYSLPLAEK